jgi:hypothetical protein
MLQISLQQYRKTLQIFGGTAFLKLCNETPANYSKEAEAAFISEYIQNKSNQQTVAKFFIAQEMGVVLSSEDTVKLMISGNYLHIFFNKLLCFSTK